MEDSDDIRCCARGCDSKLGLDGICFHHFPPKQGDTSVKLLNESGNIEEISRHDAWKRILQLEGPIAGNMCVCSKHFKESDVGGTDRDPEGKYLSANAIPTLNLHFDQPRQATSRKALRIRSDRDLFVPVKDPLELSPPKSLDVPENPLDLSLSNKWENAEEWTTSKDIRGNIRIISKIPSNTADLKEIVERKNVFKKDGVKRKLISKGLDVHLNKLANQMQTENASALNNVDPLKPTPRRFGFKRPRVTIQNQKAVSDESSTPPQIFYVDLHNQTPLDNSSKHTEPVNTSEEVVKPKFLIKTYKNVAKTHSVGDIGSTQLNNNPANSFVILKRVPKPVGIKLMPEKNIMVKRIITDSQSNVFVAQTVDQGRTDVEKPAALAKEENTIIDLYNTTEESKEPNNSADVGQVCSSKRSKAYVPVRDFCAFINCATHMKEKGKKLRFPTKETTRKIWLRNAGIPTPFPEEKIKQLFVCGKHFGKSQFTKWDSLKPGSIPKEYQLYKDHTAIDSNRHWLRKKRRTNSYNLEEVADFLTDTESNTSNTELELQNNNYNKRVIEQCCIKNCEANSSTTTLHTFPLIRDLITDPKIAEMIFKSYENKKICEKHLNHQFFTDGVLSEDALSLLDLQALIAKQERHYVIVNAGSKNGPETGKAYTPVAEYCAFVNCATHTSENVRKFRFPLSEAICQTWKENTGIPSSFPENDLIRLFVCGKHFKKTEFTKALSPPEHYRVYTDQAVIDNKPHWRRKKMMTNISTIELSTTHSAITAESDCNNAEIKIETDSDMQVGEETCCIENCQENSKSSVMHKFPSLKVIMYLINENKLSKDNLEFYKNQKICEKHLDHQFFKQAVLTKESVPLSDLSVTQAREEDAFATETYDFCIDHVDRTQLQLGPMEETSGENAIIDLCTEEAKKDNINGQTHLHEDLKSYTPIRQYCAFINCATSVKKTVKKFRFPSNEAALRTWISSAGIPSVFPRTHLKQLFVCAKHFNKSQFTKWGTLQAGSVPETYQLYKDVTASDSNTNWSRKKYLTNILNVDLSKILEFAEEQCIIKNCLLNSKTTQLYNFPSLRDLIKQSQVSNHVFKFYENRKICGKHLEHRFFKDGVLTQEALALLDLMAIPDKTNGTNAEKEVVWAHFPVAKAYQPDADIYGNVKGKAILRRETIDFPYIKREIRFPKDTQSLDQFRYKLVPFVNSAEAEKPPSIGQKVQVHTALIIDDDSEEVTIQMIRDAITRNAKRKGKRGSP